MVASLTYEEHIAKTILYVLITHFYIKNYTNKLKHTLHKKWRIYMHKS